MANIEHRLADEPLSAAVAAVAAVAAEVLGSAKAVENANLPVDLSPLILADGRRFRLPDGRRRCRSIRGRLDLGFGELAPQVC